MRKPDMGIQWGPDSKDQAKQNFREANFISVCETPHPTIVIRIFNNKSSLFCLSWLLLHVPSATWAHLVKGALSLLLISSKLSALYLVYLRQGMRDNVVHRSAYRVRNSWLQIWHSYLCPATTHLTLSVSQQEASLKRVIACFSLPKSDVRRYNL